MVINLTYRVVFRISYNIFKYLMNTRCSITGNYYYLGIGVVIVKILWVAINRN